MSLQATWMRRGPAAWALLPLSLVYGLIAAMHRAIYRWGLIQSQQMPVPVVVVGNVVAGGAGKTPVVAALVEHLRASGWQPGVVSRGYGRRQADASRQTRTVLPVTPDSDPALTGDEPLLLAQRCAVPVFVGARRADAAGALLKQHPEVDIVVCDDGLQHLALARDLEICVFDERGTGNGWLLPAGPLRERWPRRADFVLRPPLLSSLEGHVVSRRLASQAIRADGSRTALAGLAGEPVVAVAGIARPQAFFDMLQASGVRALRTIALDDHHDYEARPLGLPDGTVCVCTEKDAVKLWRSNPLAWAVPLEVTIEPAFWKALDARLAAWPRLSSRDGSQTA